jgi:hypothetical protein
MQDMTIYLNEIDCWIRQCSAIRKLVTYIDYNVNNTVIIFFVYNHKLLSPSNCILLEKKRPYIYVVNAEKLHTINLNYSQMRNVSCVDHDTSHSG